MKKLLAAAALLLAPFTHSFAQTADGDNSATVVVKPSRDFLMLQFTYEGWSNKPDSIKTKGVGRGFNAYLCYDFPIKKSNFSFAAGIGVATTNIYLDNQEMVTTDTGTLGDAVRFVPETKDYSKYKIEATYLEAPFELRYFGNKVNRSKGFKAAIGMRAGMLVGAHTKGVLTIDDNKTAEKIDTKRYLDKWRFSGTVRVGYGNFTAFASYDFGSVFKEDQGPDIRPFSVGLCLTGL